MCSGVRKYECVLVYHLAVFVIYHPVWFRVGWPGGRRDGGPPRGHARVCVALLQLGGMSDDDDDGDDGEEEQQGATPARR